MKKTAPPAPKGSHILKIDSFAGSTPTGQTRTFEVEVSGHFTLHVDTSIFEQAKADRTIIHPKPSDPFALDNLILGHLVHNLVCNQLRLSQIDGYANCPDSSVRLDTERLDTVIHRELKGKGSR